MALDESLVMVSSSSPVVEEEDDGSHQIRNTLSRLSVCTSSVHDNEAKKNQPDSGVFTSESFDGGEADGEVSDDGGGGGGKENVPEWDSDKETPQFYSLPVTPARRRRKLQVSGELAANESSSKCSLRRQKRVKKKKGINGYGCEKFNGESDGGEREGLTVLTRPKGGEKSLMMGFEDVKACRDLGFELEAPGRISSTGSNFDTQTSSGNNSPIATWRISSRGDDPKEVKARLKVWAQAVALACVSRQA